MISDAWLCADVDPRADVYVDVSKPLPFSDSELDALFVEEVIEHLPRGLGDELLRECWRTLRPGGVLRLSTPSLDHFASRALRSESARDINEVFYGHGHAYVYSRAELSRMLRDAGFGSPVESFYRDRRSELALFDSHPARFSHPPEISQYWDARKP